MRLLLAAWTELLADWKGYNGSWPTTHIEKNCEPPP